MELSLFTVLIMALCGLGIGVLASMFGIGGGTIIIPLLHIGFGFPAAASSGTSLFAILPTSIAGMVARLHDGTIRFKIGLAIGVPGILTAPLGAILADRLPGAYAMILTGLCIGYTAFRMFSKAHGARRPAPADGHGGPDSVPAPAPATGKPLVPPDYSPRCYLCCVLIGLFVGLLSGFLGLGGGFLVVPILQGVFGMTMKQSTGTSLVAVALFSVPGFVTHALLGNVEWVAGILLIVGSLAGAPIGARIVKRIDDRLLMVLFGCFLVCAGILMIVREVM